MNCCFYVQNELHTDQINPHDGYLLIAPSDVFWARQNCSNNRLCLCFVDWSCKRKNWTETCHFCEAAELSKNNSAPL